MIRTKLGRIYSVKFGIGGYQDAQMSLDITLDMDGTRIDDTFGFWADRDDHCEWTLDDQKTCFSELVIHIRDLLKASKCNDVRHLQGKPVEVTLDGNRLKSWRILEEVL